MVLQHEQHKFRRQFYLGRLEYRERFLKSKATGCGWISTVFSSIVLLCVRSIIIRKIVILIVINSYTIIKDNDNESDDEIND